MDFAAPGKRRLRSALTNLFLALLSLVLFVVLAEVALVLVGYEPSGWLLDGRQRILRRSADAKRLYEAIPHAEGDAWGTSIRINAAGFRGRDHALVKPPGTSRIVVLGDSIVFGNMLKEEETFPALLEKKHRDQGRAVEVLNLGLGGYNTFQEVATFESVGLPLTPDVVVVSYCLNDISAGSPNLFLFEGSEKAKSLLKFRLTRMIKTKLDFLLIKRHLQEENRESTFVANRVGFISKIDENDEIRAAMAEAEAELPESDEIHYSAPFYASPAHVGHLRYSFEWLAQLSREHGFAIWVLIVPFLEEDATLEPRYQAAYRVIQHEAMRLDFDALSLRDSFLEAGMGNLKIKRNDGIHPNALGHRLMADHLFRSLSSRSVFIQTPPPS